MAKGASAAIASVFSIILTILALNFIALSILVAGQYYTGRLSKEDLWNILLVLRGNRSYAMSKDQVAEYKDLLRDREERRQQVNEEKGLGPARDTAAEVASAAMRMQKEKAAELADRLANERRKLEELRSRIEALKQEHIAEREKLLEQKRQEVQVQQSANREKLRRTLSGMDAEDVSLYFSTLVKKNRPEEAARLIRDYLAPDFAAEVLTETPPADRQQILPLLENDFAGLPAQDIVRRWRTEDVQPVEMAEYIRKMTAPQALRTYLQLDPNLRAQVAQRLLRD